MVPGALVLLVGALATLQYHWLGRVSEAERERLQTTLRQRAEEFSDEFDREILHLYLMLQLDSRAAEEANWEPFDRSYQAWRTSAKYPEILRALYLVDAERLDTTLRMYNADARTFAPIAWPASIEPVHQRLADARGGEILTLGTVGGARLSGAARAPDAPGRESVDTRHFMAIRDPIVAEAPAVLVPVPAVDVKTIERTDLRSMVSVRSSATYLIAELDRGYLESTLIPALAARHFPARGADRYVLSIVESGTSRAVFARGLPAGASFDPDEFDASVPLFRVRFDLTPQILTHVLAARSSGAAAEIFRIAPMASAPAGATAVRESFSIFLESRGGRPGSDTLKLNAHPLGAAAWQLVIRHSAGSLDAAVAQARRRNLALSFSILAVLAVSVGLIVINARRSERLASQQMDFVATVSHELRTPLAVIRSAAQNLSAGVVHDATQAKRYGDLIEAEGRRLTDMVEQVLEYAGIGGSRQPVLAKPVDAGALLESVATSHATRFASEGVEAAVSVDQGLPPVLADEGALRRALDNLVTNALKYGAEGRRIELAATRGGRGGDEVQISVTDRGRGIDPVDLPHVFEPFYRGRDVLDRQIHGNGLGLSLVKRIADAHGGRVSVRSSPGEGATFTLHLPSAKTSPGERTPGIVPNGDGPGADLK